MWNAGVLGFKVKDKSLINNVLQLSDNMYEDFKIHVIEQLAFSIIFSSQAGKKLLNCDDKIYHYWNFKEFREVLKLFFEKNKKTELQSKFKNIDPRKLIKPKLEYENSNFILKFIKKLNGKWKFPEFNI